VICVYSCPPQFSADIFGQKMKELMENIASHDIRDNFSHYSLVGGSLDVCSIL
jgi:hypothetical protein